MRKSTTALALLIAAGTFSTAVLANGPAWRYVEGGYTSLDGDGGLDADGAFIGGKYQINPNVYLNGEFTFVEEGSADINLLTLGGGYIVPLNTTTDAYAGINFERVDTDGYDDNGYSLAAGVRSMVTDVVEVTGELGYYDVSDGDITFKVGGNYYISPELSVGASYKFMDGGDIMQLGARYAF